VENEKTEENEQSDPSVSVTVNKMIVNNGTGINYVRGDQTTTIVTTNSPTEGRSTHLDEEDFSEGMDEAYEPARSWRITRLTLTVTGARPSCSPACATAT
jgi:hypothetical protein